MTITLTREEARQILDALNSMNGAEFLCNASHHGKKDWHQIGDVCPVTARYMAAREFLCDQLNAPKPEPVGWTYEDDEGRITFSQMPQNPPLWEPVYKRNLKEKNT